MDIGRKIYFEKTNGVIIWDKGEITGNVRETTLQEDIEAMPVLSLIDESQLGVLQLEYGAYRVQFRSCRGYKVNPATLQIEFVY